MVDGTGSKHDYRRKSDTGITKRRLWNHREVIEGGDFSLVTSFLKEFWHVIVTY
jgi:hypothetical protein